MLHRNKRKKRRNFKLLILIIMILTLFMGCFCLFEFKAKDLVGNLVYNEMENCATSALDGAVLAVLDKEIIEYSELIDVKRDSGGNVCSLSTNTLEANRLKAKLSYEIVEYIKNDVKATVKIPAGAFTGIVLISQIGPKIPVSLTYGGSVNSSIVSEFKSTGINQTIHRIYLHIDADVSLTCPIISYDCKIKSEYLISETVIVGSIPQFYANIDK